MENLSENWNLQVDPRVYKELDKFPKEYAERIIETIESLAFDPYAGDIQKIKGEENVWRRRAGNYRIFYEIHPDKKFIHIFHIERRTSKTY